jgi:polyferredoxin
MRRRRLKELTARKTRLLRHISQILSFLLLNALLFGVMKTGFVIPIEYPNGAPYGAIMGSFYAFQLVTGSGAFPFMALATFALFGALFGRGTCAWLCPFGAFQDLASYAPVRHSRPNKRTNKSMQDFGKIFIVITAIIVAAIGFRTYQDPKLGDEIRTAFGVFADEPFSPLSPVTTLFSAFPMLFFFWGPSSLADVRNVPILFWIRIIIFVSVVILVIFVKRGWCRWLCPTGLLLGYCAKFSVVGIARDPTHCDRCGDCELVCPMGVPLLDYTYERIRDEQCILCLECRESCHSKAIQLTFGK